MHGKHTEDLWKTKFFGNKWKLMKNWVATQRPSQLNAIAEGVGCGALGGLYLLIIDRHNCHKFSVLRFCFGKINSNCALVKNELLSIVMDSQRNIIKLPFKDYNVTKPESRGCGWGKDRENKKPWKIHTFYGQ